MIITLLSLVIVSFAIKIKFKISEEEAIFVSLICIGLFTYILGLINLMIVAVVLIPIIAIISLIYTILKIKEKQEKISELITLPLIIYCIAYGIIYCITRNASLQNIDDYMFWATNLKTMCATDLLWAHASLDLIHQVYPPFAGIIEYIFCKLNGGYSEQIAIFAINIIKITAIMPLLKQSKYNLKTFLKTALLIVIIYVTQTYLLYKFGTLLVDSLIGIMFAVAMYMAFTLKEKKDYIIYTFLLIALTLVKTNGMLFAGISVLQLFLIYVFETIRNKEWNKKLILKKIQIILILLMVILISFATWKLYYTINGKKVDERHDKNSVDNINLVTLYNDIMQNENATDRDNSIVQSFWTKIKELKVTVRETYYSTADILIVVSIICILFFVLSKEKTKFLANFISINIGLIIYCITVLILFLFVFVETEALNLIGFTRYINTYLLAMILNIVFIISKEYEIKNILCLVLVTFILGKDLNNMNVNLSLYTNEISKEIENNAEILKENVQEDEKVYIINQGEDSNLEFFKLRYLIAPIQTNLLYEWYLVINEDNYLYGIEISAEDLINKIIDEGYDYVFVVDVDLNFIKYYGDIFDDAIIENLQDLAENGELYYGKQLEGLLLTVDKENRIIK